jgi:hypothetical protein
MKQIEKIKKEIERRMLEDYNSSDAQKDEIAQGVCAGILTFINSLQAEPMSEDLELASERYACKFSSSKYGHYKVKDAVVWGANWQKEQMLKDAVEGSVSFPKGGLSNSAQYKLAGNSIVVDVLYHIFRKLLVETKNENKQPTLF